MGLHKAFKLVVGVVLAASVGFLALLGYAAWTIKPERNACGSVSPGGLVTVPQDAPPAPWVQAVAAPGWMQEADEIAARYRYFEPGNSVQEKITVNGQAVPRTAASMRDSCAEMDGPPDYTCRFHEDDSGVGMMIFRRDHILESQRDYVASSIQKLQADGALVEVYVTSRDTHALEAAECDMARALWYLSGRD